MCKPTSAHLCSWPFHEYKWDWEREESRSVSTGEESIWAHAKQLENIDIYKSDTEGSTKKRHTVTTTILKLLQKFTAAFWSSYKSPLIENNSIFKNVESKQYKK